MTGDLAARNRRTLAVPLLALVVMCFLCALCHSAPLSSQAAPVSTVTAPVVSAEDCPDGVEGIAGTGEPDAATPAGQSPGHPCDPADGQVPPTGQPLAHALGAALLPLALLAPRPGAPRRPVRRPPSAPHGHGLLTLLCVRRV